MQKPQPLAELDPRPVRASESCFVKAWEEGWPPSPQLGPQIARERDAGDLGEREGQQREWTLAKPFLRSRCLSNTVTWRSKPVREICRRCALVCLSHERCSLIVAAFVEELDVGADAPRCATLSRDDPLLRPAARDARTRGRFIYARCRAMWRRTRSEEAATASAFIAISRDVPRCDSRRSCGFLPSTFAM